MADVKYGVDDEGNLVEVGRPVAEGAVAGDAGEAPEQPVTEQQRQLFLWALGAGDLIGVVVLGGSALLLPESRTVLAILALAYLLVSVPIFVWMSRSTKRKVDASQRRALSS